MTLGVAASRDSDTGDGTLSHEKLDRCERLAVDPGPLVYATRTAAKVGEPYCRISTSWAGAGVTQSEYGPAGCNGSVSGLSAR